MVLSCLLGAMSSLDELETGNIACKHLRPVSADTPSLAPQEDLVDEVADIDTVPNEKKQHEVTAAISNSFGFGGHNSVCVFGPWSNGH